MESKHDREPASDTAKKDEEASSTPVSRRNFVGVVVAGGVASAALPSTANAFNASENGTATASLPCSLTINGKPRQLTVDPRTTLLDLLRENLHLTGTKKGCDHGQCGACTVMVNGQRINSCLSFAVMHDGDEITTVEGLADNSRLHPMQVAFIDYDGFQCGYCTPGQICSAVAMLKEAKNGVPSAVTKNVADVRPVALSDDEIRERMSGNLCRCGAYVGIVEAIRTVNGGNLEGDNA